MYLIWLRNLCYFLLCGQRSEAVKVVGLFDQGKQYNSQFLYMIPLRTTLNRSLKVSILLPLLYDREYF